MKVDVMGLLRNSATGLRNSDPLTAYCLLELANNLRLLMNGEEDLAEFKKVYVGAGGDPIDIDAIMPPAPEDEPAQPEPEA